MEGQGFRDRSLDFQARNAVILGASFDSAQENKAFKDKYDFPYDLLCDVDKSVAVAYGAAADASASSPARISYLIDPNGKIAKVYGNVSPAEHPDKVLGDIG